MSRLIPIVLAIALIPSFPDTIGALRILRSALGLLFIVGPPTVLRPPSPPALAHRRKARTQRLEPYVIERGGALGPAAASSQGPELRWAGLSLGVP
jgi:hypothetical protein